MAGSKLRSLVRDDRRLPRLSQEEHRRAWQAQRARERRKNGISTGGGSLRPWEGDDPELRRTHTRRPGVAVTTRDQADRYLIHYFERPATKTGALAVFRAAAQLHAREVKSTGGLHGRIETEVAELCDVWAPVHTKPCADGGAGGREPLWMMSLNH